MGYINIIPTYITLISVFITAILCILNNVSFFGSMKRLCISALIFYLLGIMVRKSIKNILSTFNNSQTITDVTKTPEIKKEDFTPLNPDTISEAVRVIRGSLKENGRNK